jgi:hypothetical protein
VVPRGDGTVQIGSEPPHWLVLHRAPPRAVSVLKRLDGTRAVAEVLQFHDADPVVWRGLLTKLRDARLLVSAADWSFPGISPGPFLEPERDSLVHRHGIPVARRVLQARQDAVVVVRGSGRMAIAVASSLAASGVGHVHQQADRSLRLADLPEDGIVRPSDGGPGQAASTGPVRSTSSPSRADMAALAANLRRVAPQVKVHQPAPHHRVDLVVLAGDGPPAPSLGAELTQQRIPHLAVRAGLTTTVVGPFVLPGRSSCLACALRQRTEFDSGRPMFEEGLRQELVVPPTQLVCAGASLAVSDALDHLDGVTVPTTIDGTVEWSLGQLAPRRRSWAAHPECGCHRVSPGVNGRNSRTHDRR